MTVIEVLSWGKYRYLVGNGTVGIIPPSRHKHLARLADVKAGGELIPNGTSDGRVSPDDVAAYIVKNNIR